MKFSHNVFDHDTQTMFGFCTYSLYGFRVMLLNYLINEKFVVFMLGLPMAKCFDIFKQRLTTIHRSSCIFAFMPFIFLSYTPVYLSWKHGDLCAVDIFFHFIFLLCTYTHVKLYLFLWLEILVLSEKDCHIFHSKQKHALEYYKL